MLLAMSDVTRILSQIESGDPSAAEQLLPLVYDELRKLAAAKLAHEKSGQTLQATALVHEAYLRLVENREQGTGDEQQRSHWNSRGHFFAAAAEAMRRILIGQARHKASLKAGGQRQRVELSDVQPEIQGPELDLIALDAALEELAARDPRAAMLVKLRFFAGLTMLEAAQALGVSLATVENDWAYAKCWLRLQISDSDGRHS
jgi:RNA polymerase sigma factor (TIGR02999 family)